MSRAPVDPPEDMLAVPRVQQETDYSCGAAALLAIFRFWDVDGGATEADLYDDIDTTERDGTAPEAMAEEAEARGLKSNFRDEVTVDDLRDAITAGYTVVLNIQADEPDEETSGHYVVAVAVDDQRVWFMDPSSGDYESMRIDELEQRWHDGGMDNAALFISGD